MYQLNIVTQSASSEDFTRIRVLFHAFFKPQNYSVGHFILKLVTRNLYSLNYSRVENRTDAQI